MAKESTIQVLVYEPDQPPRVEAIANTLEAKQHLVGGYIEMVPLELDARGTMRTLDIVLNEEGKLNQLPFNRLIWDGQDAVVGTFLIVACNSTTGECVSLTDMEIEYVQSILP